MRLSPRFFFGRSSRLRGAGDDAVPQAGAGVGIQRGGVQQRQAVQLHGAPPADVEIVLLGLAPKEHGRCSLCLGKPQEKQNEKGASTNSRETLEDDWPESILEVLIQLRRHLFTSLRRACLRAAMLSVYGHMRAPSHHPTFLSNCAARFLTKVVCASCIVPGCCAQVALCKLLRASALCKLLCASAPSKLLCARALRQLLRASALRMCSAQVGLCKLLCACSVQVALRKCSEQVALRKGSAPVAPCKRFAHVLVCASCSAQVLCAIALCKLLCASCSAQVTLRKLLCASAAGAAGVRSAYYVCT